MTDLVITKELAGIEDSKARQIEAVFTPMIEMLKSFESAYDEIVSKEINNEVCKNAKSLRIKISKIRINADKTRKAQKEEYLRAGNAIQGVYNILKYAVTEKEEKLKEIETYFERLELERVSKLQSERQAELIKYDANGEFIELGKMSDEVWHNYLSGVKMNYEAVKEAEAKVEADRIAKERAEKEEQERIRKENELLKKEREKADKKRIALEKENEKKQAKEREKLEIERKKQEEIIRKEHEKREIERKKQEEIIRKEREKNKRLEAEKRKLEERELKEKKAKKEQERKAALAPDKEKLVAIAGNLIDKLSMFSSVEAKNAIKAAANILSSCAEEM